MIAGVQTGDDQRDQRRHAEREHNCGDRRTEKAQDRHEVEDARDQREQQRGGNLQDRERHEHEDHRKGASRHVAHDVSADAIACFACGDVRLFAMPRRGRNAMSQS